MQSFKKCRIGSVVVLLLGVALASSSPAAGHTKAQVKKPQPVATPSTPVAPAAPAQPPSPIDPSICTDANSCTYDPDPGPGGDTVTAGDSDPGPPDLTQQAPGPSNMPVTPAPPVQAPPAPPVALPPVDQGPTFPTPVAPAPPPVTPVVTPAPPTQAPPAPTTTEQVPVAPQPTPAAPVAPVTTAATTTTAAPPASPSVSTATTTQPTVTAPQVVMTSAPKAPVAATTTTVAAPPAPKEPTICTNLPALTAVPDTMDRSADGVCTPKCQNHLEYTYVPDEWQKDSSGNCLPPRGQDNYLMCLGDQSKLVGFSDVDTQLKTYTMGIYVDGVADSYHGNCLITDLKAYGYDPTSFVFSGKYVQDGGPGDAPGNKPFDSPFPYPGSHWKPLYAYWVPRSTATQYVATQTTESILASGLLWYDGNRYQTANAFTKKFLSKTKQHWQGWKKQNPAFAAALLTHQRLLRRR
jgi:hypothetical protein